jgi:predicted RNase H-like HicB family nuclease
VFIRVRPFSSVAISTAYGDIPAIPGVWANANTLGACREELESVLEGWVLVSIADHSPIPDVDGTWRT